MVTHRDQFNADLLAFIQALGGPVARRISRRVVRSAPPDAPATPEDEADSATRRKLNGVFAASPRDTWKTIALELQQRAAERGQHRQPRLHAGEGGEQDADPAEQIEDGRQA